MFDLNDVVQTEDMVTGRIVAVTGNTVFLATGDHVGLLPVHADKIARVLVHAS